MYAFQLEEKEESSELRWLPWRLLECQRGIVIQPVLVITLNRKVEVKADDVVSTIAGQTLRRTHSSSCIQHALPNPALMDLSSVTSTLYRKRQQ